MDKYKVVIEEQVLERRTYEVEAPGPLEAAAIAAHRWLNLAEDPLEGVEIGDVTDRDYTVTDALGVKSVFGSEAEAGEEFSDA